MLDRIGDGELILSLSNVVLAPLESRESIVDLGPIHLQPLFSLSVECFGLGWAIGVESVESGLLDSWW